LEGVACTVEYCVRRTRIAFEDFPSVAISTDVVLPPVKEEGWLGERFWERGDVEREGVVLPELAEKLSVSDLDTRHDVSLPSLKLLLSLDNSDILEFSDVLLGHALEVSRLSVKHEVGREIARLLRSHAGDEEKEAIHSVGEAVHQALRE
jgi:hypothetical protein